MQLDEFLSQNPPASLGTRMMRSKLTHKDAKKKKRPGRG
jgi:hypothetical protein